MARGLTGRNEACLGCIYFAETTLTCDYILMTDKRRPCPPGKGCTVRSVPIKKKLTASGKLDRDAMVRALYKDGANDREIADLLGYSVDAIFKWRKRHGYESNYKRKGGRPAPPKRD